jgi:hypothetical protein
LYFAISVTEQKRGIENNSFPHLLYPNKIDLRIKATEATRGLIPLSINKTEQLKTGVLCYTQTENELQTAEASCTDSTAIQNQFWLIYIFIHIGTRNTRAV